MLAAALVVAHGLAAAALLPAALPLAIKVLLWFGLVLSLVFCRARRRLPLRGLTLLADGSLEVERTDGTRSAAQVKPQTTVLPWLCVLRMNIDGRAFALAIPPDALAADDFRRLRLWLRWMGAGGR